MVKATSKSGTSGAKNGALLAHKAKDPKIVDVGASDDRFETIIAIIIVIALMAGASWWGFTRYSDLRNPVEVEETRVPMTLGGSPSIGAENATITVVEFSDYECPFCGVFARESYPAIKERFIDTGTVRFVYKHFPLQTHPYAAIASVAAVCAQEQDAFWEYNDVLYAHQEDLEVEQLVGYAADLGLDKTLFRDCLISQETLPLVNRDKQFGLTSGVTGTPTFFFNGRKVVGALTPEEFAKEIEKELAPTTE